MQQHNIAISDDFKKTAYNAILSIALFVFVYLLLVLTGVCLTIAPTAALCSLP